MAKQKKLPPKLQAWVDARKRFHLSHAHVQMARELGMNPKKLGGLANQKQEPWKFPLPQYIEELYFKRLKKERPDNVRSIKQMVAERLRFSPDEALSLAKAVAGLNAQAKGRALGIFKAKRESIEKAKRRAHREEFWIELCGRPVPAKNTDEGVRAVSGDKPIDPDRVARYLSHKFGDNLDSVKEAMEGLAGACGPDDLAERAFASYERFRPAIPAGKKGWGAKGQLDLDLIRSLAARK